MRAGAFGLRRPRRGAQRAHAEREQQRCCDELDDRPGFGRAVRAAGAFGEDQRERGEAGEHERRASGDCPGAGECVGLAREREKLHGERRRRDGGERERHDNPEEASHPFKLRPAPREPCAPGRTAVAGER